MPIIKNLVLIISRAFIGLLIAVFYLVFLVFHISHKTAAQSLRNRLVGPDALCEVFSLKNKVIAQTNTTVVQGDNLEGQFLNGGADFLANRGDCLNGPLRTILGVLDCMELDIGS